MAFQMLQRGDVRAKKNADLVKVWKIAKKHASNIGEASTKCDKYSGRLRLRKTLKGTIAKRFGDAFRVIRYFEIFVDIGQLIEAIGRPFEIRLGNLYEIGREINPKPSSAPGENRIGNRTIAAA